MHPTVPITVNATYEGGLLKLEQPLQFPEGTKLQVTIGPPSGSGVLDERDRQIVREIVDEDREVFKALAQ